MIGVPYNINTCIFITSQTLNADQFNSNVPNSGNSSTHNMLWDTANKSLIWVDTKTNLIIFEIAGGGGFPFGNDVGVVNAYQAIIPDATLTDGYAFEIKIANTNTGASTLQINALGVLPFVDVKGNPFVAGIIEVNSIYIATYNSTFNAYQLLGESRPEVAITNNVIPKGNGVSIVDGSWSFSVNDIIPNTSGSNIGDDTHRIGTIFMASNIDYASDLYWINGIDIRMTLTTGGSLGIGTTAITATLHVRGIDDTVANYTLKADNSIAEPLLYARNDGFVGASTSGPNSPFSTFSHKSKATQGAGYVWADFFSPNGTTGLNIKQSGNFANWMALTAGSFNAGFGNSLEMDCTPGSEEAVIGGYPYAGGGSFRVQTNNYGSTSGKAMAIGSGEHLINQGPRLWWYGASLSSSNQQDKYGDLHFYKENAVDGDFKAYFTIGVNDGALSATTIDRLKISSNGQINFNFVQLGNAGLTSGDIYKDATNALFIVP
jgi:hypothetical protein